MPMFDLTCSNDHEQYDVMVKGDKPPCRECGLPTITLWRGKAAGVIPDDIPGGMLVHHGLCNPDGSPRKYYSKSEMRQEAERRGLTNRVEHITPKGTDRSPATTRWI